MQIDNNKMNVIDFFSGCGGLSYGFVQAGFNVIIGIDNNKTALKTFEKNHPNSKGLCLDLFDKNFITELNKEVNGRQIDIIVGGPPCQGFSLTGTRDSKDKRNELFRSMFVAIDEYNPKVVVIENVPGLKNLYGGYYYNAICEEFNLRNYHVVAKVLYAPEYGVPQIRKRLVFIATRSDLEAISHPLPVITNPDNFVTTKEAISDLPALLNEEENEFYEYNNDNLSDYQRLMREGSSGIYNHIPTHHTDMVKNVIAMVPDGGNYKDLPEGIGGSRKFNEAWTRYSSNKPSKTIDTGHRNHFHYKYNRIPTVRENARLQSFPDKFIILGNKTEQYRQVGNAVPPILGYHIAEAIKKQIKIKNKIKTIDLFAGCGGLMDGFESSGKFDTVACVEWEKAPCENLSKRLTEKWLHKDAKDFVLKFDIQRTDELFDGWENDPVYGSHVGLNKIIEVKGKPEVIIGGPPCQAYSIAGRIRDENHMQNDYRNFLFESYIKVVDKYKPKAFIFENVPGILSAKANGKVIVDEIKKQFTSIGYTILENLKEAIVDMSEYGVPQFRNRIIILGIRNDISNIKEKLKSFYNEILPKYKEPQKTVRMAIEDLPKLFPVNNKILKQSHCQNSNDFINNHIPRWHSERDINIFKMLAEDIENKKFVYKDVNKLKELYTQMTGKTSNVHKYHVLDWDKPSTLIPAHLYKDGLRHIHPDSKQARSITVREAARLQGFNDDYVFIGSQMDQYKMIGNAVPPCFSNKLAEALYELLFKE